MPIVEIEMNVDGGHTAVRGFINDVGPVWIAIDSAASGIVLDSRFADERGLQATGSHSVLGAGGVESGRNVPGIRVSAGNRVIADGDAAVVPLDFIERRTGRRISAIVGLPLFQRFAVQLDYTNRRLRLFQLSGFEHSGVGRMPLLFKDGHPYITATLVLDERRSVTGQFVLDTGSGAAVMLADASIQLPGPTLTANARGVGGELSLRQGRARGLQLGGASLHGPIVQSIVGDGRIAADGTAGNIGGDILRRFVVTFDYGRGHVFLEPARDLDEPFEIDMSGLSLEVDERGTVQVARVRPESPAAIAGVLPGDEIVLLNGASTPALLALRPLLRREGERVVLTLLRQGRTVMADIRLKRAV